MKRDAGEVDDVPKKGNKDAVIHWLVGADVVNVACPDSDTFFGGDKVGNFWLRLRHSEESEWR